MKVKIKTWDEMVKEFGWFDCKLASTSPNIKLTKFGWCKELEELMPSDRIIEVESRYSRFGEYHMVGHKYGISQDAIREYLDESGNNLTKRSYLMSLSHNLQKVLLFVICKLKIR